jgi:hypothetical protein
MPAPFTGMPFSLEGFAFFAEAIFLGIYLYGWNRVPPLPHLFARVTENITEHLRQVYDSQLSLRLLLSCEHNLRWISPS